MAVQLEGNVVRNVDYSKPHAAGEWKQTSHTRHIFNKTYLDLYLPASRKVKHTNAIKQSCEVAGMPPQSNSDAPPDGDGDLLRRTDGTEGRTKPPPLVLFAHGGGWRRGDKQAWQHYISRWDMNLAMAAKVGLHRLYGNVGESFVSRGVACAAVSYPLVPTVFPINMLEMCTSYLMTVLFTLILTLTLCFSLDVFYLIIFLKSFTLELWVVWDQQSGCPALTALSMMMTASQIITLALILKRETYIHKLNKSYDNFIGLISLTAVSTWLWIFWSQLISFDCKIALLAFSMTVYVQTLIFHYQWQTTSEGDMLAKCSRTLRNPHSQARNIAQAVRWLVDYGQSTGQFDPNSIILCGHSAGGHLVSLVVLDDQYLTEVGLSRGIIKGVITLSAIHDVHTMNTGLIHHIYLKPAFGTDPADWTRLSPITYLSSSCEHQKPQFLVVSAEKDLGFVIEDSDKMHQELRRCGFVAHRAFTQGCNHFTLVEKFGRPWYDFVRNRRTWRESDVERTCWEFVEKIMHTKED